MMGARIIGVFAVALAVAGCGGDGGAGADAAASGDATVTDGGAATIVDITTTMGTMTVQLYPQYMPVTTANFLSYVDSGFYDGTLVHRVVDDWVIQGGGWTSGLVPKPPNAPIPLETSPMVSHVHGAISMARDPTDEDSATSQWFIVDAPKTGPAPQPDQLDGNFAAFGVLIDGFDVLEQITQVATHTASTMGSPSSLDDVPVTEIVVTSMSRR